MNYYTIDLKTNNKIAFIETVDSNVPKVGRTLSKGEPLALEDPFFKAMYANDKGIFTDVMSVNPLIVNGQVKEILTNLNDSMEFYEIDLVSIKNKSIKKGYYVVNILENLDAIDTENSDLEYYPNSEVISSISRLKLKEDKIGNRSIFGIKKISREIFINERVYELLNDISGLEIKNINEFIKI